MDMAKVSLFSIPISDSCQQRKRDTFEVAGLILLLSITRQDSIFIHYFLTNSYFPLIIYE